MNFHSICVSHFVLFCMLVACFLSFYFCIFCMQYLFVFLFRFVLFSVKSSRTFCTILFNYNVNIAQPSQVYVPHASNELRLFLIIFIRPLYTQSDKFVSIYYSFSFQALVLNKRDTTFYRIPELEHELGYLNLSTNYHLHHLDFKLI